MPQLLLMRHGKASQGAGLADRERPLTPRGRRDCELTGAALPGGYRPGPHPVLAGPAHARDAGGAAAGIGEVSDVDFLDALYDHPGDYTGVVAANGAQLRTPAGHRPQPGGPGDRAHADRRGRQPRSARIHPRQIPDQRRRGDRLRRRLARLEPLSRPAGGVPDAARAMACGDSGDAGSISPTRRPGLMPRRRRQGMAARR